MHPSETGHKMRRLGPSTSRRIPAGMGKLLFSRHLAALLQVSFLPALRLYATLAVLAGCAGSGAEGPADTTPPAITSVGPADGAVGISISRAITVSFSEPLRTDSITDQTFLVRTSSTPLPNGGASDGGPDEAVPGTIEYYGTRASFTPLARLRYATRYTVTLTTGLRDVAGNALAADYTFSFTTGAAVDTTPPTVTATSPADLAVGVPLNAQVSVAFSEPIDPTSVGPPTFLVTLGPDAATGTFTVDGARATFRPSVSFAPNTTYALSLTRGVRDLAGNPLTAETLVHFTTGPMADTTAPTVVATTPPSGLAVVAPNVLISATFSKDVDATTVDGRSFTLTAGGTAIPGNLSYNGRRAVFSPLQALRGGAQYTASLSAQVRDVAGNALVPASWSFSTGPAVDTTPPVVVSTVPERNAASVALNTALTATFSEPMDPASLSPTTFTVTAGTTPQTGVVTYANGTVTFAPATALRPSTRYTARIGSGARDAAGNGLPETYTWSFVTGVAADVTPPRISSTSPLAGATGVPTSRVITVAFTEAVAPATVTAQSFYLVDDHDEPVAGSVTVAGAIATFRPVQALGDDRAYTALVTTAVTDLAGNALTAQAHFSFRTAPDLTPPTLQATSPQSEASGVAPDAIITATFSEPIAPASATAQSVVVSAAGAQVAGTVSVAGAIVRFTPQAPLRLDTLYTATFSTGLRDLAHNALPVAYTWRFSTRPDTTPPTVLSAVPLAQATAVDLAAQPRVTFSEAMDPTTLNADSVRLVDGASAPVALGVGYNGSVLTIVPTAALRYSTRYTATLTTAAADLAGNGLVAPYSWSFTTVADHEPPTVAATAPADGATGVDLGSTVRLTFSEPMDGATLTAAALSVVSGGVPVPGALTATATTLTFTPTLPLAFNTRYDVTVGTAATDLAGNHLGAAAHVSFTTVADTRPPTVDTTVPANGDVNVARATTVRATFSRPMNAATINAQSFTLQSGGGNLAGVLVASGTTATLTLGAPLSFGTTYVATLAASIEDVDGNALPAPVQWSFTTVADTAPPTVTGVTPAAAAIGVPVGTSVTASFSKPLEPSSVNANTFTLTQDGAVSKVEATVRYGNGLATLTPAAPLAQGVVYNVLLTGIRDFTGNVLAAGYGSTFTTVPDTTPPTVRARSPEPGTTGVPTSIIPRVVFSEAIDTAAATFTLSQGPTDIPATLASTDAQLTLTPAGPLDNGLVYTLRVGGIHDLAGNALADFTWSFTTVLDTTPPTVFNTYPGASATYVPPNTTISAYFPEVMDLTTLGDALTLMAGSTSVPGTLATAATSLTFTPTAPLTNNTVYTATVATTVKDVHGNAMAAPYTWSFTTVGRAWGNSSRLVSSFIYQDPKVQTGADSASNVFIVYLSACNMCAPGIRARRYTPPSGAAASTLSPEAGLTSPTAPPLLPFSLAVSPGGTALVLWTQLRYPAYRYGVTYVRFDGTTWSAPAFIDNNTADSPGVGSPGVESYRAALLASGDGIAVYAQRTSGVNAVWYNRLTSGVWGTAAVLASSGARQATDPRIAFDSSGNALLVYREYDVGGMQVMARKLNAGTGTWSAPEAVSAVASAITNLELAMNGSGLGVVTWTQNDAAESLQSLWAMRRMGPLLTGAWGLQRTLDNVALVDGGAAVAVTSLAPIIASNGDAVVTWTKAGAAVVTRYAQGSGWSAPASLNAGFVRMSAPAHLSAGPEGAAFASYQVGAQALASRVYPASGVEPGTGGVIGQSWYGVGSAYGPQTAFFPDGAAVGIFATLNQGSTYISYDYYTIYYNEFR